MSRATAVIREWRWPALVALGVIVAGVVIALLQPSPAGYLDPNGTGPQGGHALADLLTERGQHVQRTAAPAGPGSGPGELEVITSPDLLTPAQLDQAGRFGGDIMLVDPDPAALRAVAPRVAMTGAGPEAIAGPCAPRGPRSSRATPTSAARCCTPATRPRRSATRSMAASP